MKIIVKLLDIGEESVFSNEFEVEYGDDEEEALRVFEGLKWITHRSNK